MEGLYSLRGNAQMQYRHEIEHAPANFAPAERRTALVIRKRSEAVWVYKWGTLSLASPLRREGLFSLLRHAQMQYRHDIEHALANFAFVAVLTSSFALLAFSKY